MKENQLLKRAKRPALPAILAAVLLVLNAASLSAQAASASPLKFTVHVTYMTQGGTKKTDRVAVLAADPVEAEQKAEAQFKEKNRRSTFIKAEAEFNRASAPVPEAQAVAPLKFTVHVTYMTRGGTKKTDSVAVLAGDPVEAEQKAEAQFTKKNPRSTFIKAEAEFARTRGTK